MNSHKDTADKLYGEKLRVRVCGVLITEKGILLAGHLGLSKSSEFWMPPGGGVEFGEPLEVALKREFKEETGLEIETERLLAVHEFINYPMHALEFFFLVKNAKGEVITGSDPEMVTQAQLITKVKFFSLADLKTMPSASLHPIMRDLESFEHLISSPFRLTSEVGAKK